MTLFSKIIRGEIACLKVWEDEHSFAFLDIKPVQEGHTLVVPKKEVDQWMDLETEDLCQLMTASKTVAEILKKATGAARIGMWIEGFAVPHVHIHLIPINTGRDLDPALARDATPEELKKVHQKILAVTLLRPGGIGTSEDFA